MFPVVTRGSVLGINLLISLFCFLFCCWTQIPVISSLLRMISRGNSLLRKLPLCLKFVRYLSSHQAVREAKLSSLPYCFPWGPFWTDEQNEEIHNYMILWILVGLVTVGWQHTNVSNLGHLSQGWSPSLLSDIHRVSSTSVRSSCFVGVISC